MNCRLLIGPPQNVNVVFDMEVLLHYGVPISDTIVLSCAQSDGPVRTYNVRPNVIGRVDLAPVEVQKASHRLNAYS